MKEQITQPFLSYLRISLWISSAELTPENITELVGLQPTHTRLRGSLISGRNVPRRPEFDFHEWRFGRQFDAKLGTYIGHFVEEFITTFLNEIKAYTPQIKKLSEHHSVMFSLVYHVSELPYLGLTRDQVQAIAALGAELDYDLMIETISLDGDHASDGTGTFEGIAF